MPGPDFQSKLVSHDSVKSIEALSRFPLQELFCSCLARFYG